MSLLSGILILLIGALASGADVFFVEEIVNPGFGPQQLGARKTTNKIYIKGTRQKVESNIETNERTAKALRDQGQALSSSTILQLEANQVYEIDLEALTFVEEKMPPPAKSVAQKAASTNPRIEFAVKETGDTTRVAGILSHRVIAQMRARYFDPQTQRPRKENRYTYDAWIARDFPGYAEIEAFQRMQEAQTAYPPLIGGGLEQLRATVEDYEQLVDQLEALEGFPLRSTIRVTVLRPGQTGESTVFELNREIVQFSHSPLPDSLFSISKKLTRIEGK